MSRLSENLQDNRQEFGARQKIDESIRERKSIDGIKVKDPNKRANTSQVIEPIKEENEESAKKTAVGWQVRNSYQANKTLRGEHYIFKNVIIFFNLAQAL